MKPKIQKRMRARYHVLFAELCNQFDKPQTTQYRHQITRFIFGDDKPSNQWSAADYMRVFNALQRWIYSDTEPAALTANQRNHDQHEQAKKQLIHAIESFKLGDAYIQKIATDKYGHRHWREHGVFQLKQLRMTLKTRARNKACKQPANDFQATCNTS